MSQSVNIVHAKLNKSVQLEKTRNQLLNIRHNCEVSSPFIRQTSSIQDKKLKLTFGKKLAKASPGQYLNPRLYGLLQYIYRVGPQTQEWNYSELSAEEIVDKKEIKALLNEGGVFCISDYSVKTVLFVLRSFLKHMPEPLLDKELYNLWLEIGNILCIDSNFPVAAKTQLMLHDLPILMENASYYVDLLLRHLLVALHSLCCRNRQTPDMNAVQQLAQLFAPYIVYKRFEWAKGRTNYKKLTNAKKALVSFLILHVYQIFGLGAQNLYPFINLQSHGSFHLCPPDDVCSSDCTSTSDTHSIDQYQDELIKNLASDDSKTCLKF